MVYYGNNVYTPHLYHHGIKGQKWGVRRYQNEDGSYTQAGRNRYLKLKNTYNTARQYLKADKADYRSGRMSKEEYGQHKQMVRQLRKKSDQAYKDIRFDKAADAGRAAYDKKMAKTNDSEKANKAAKRAYYNKVGSNWVADNLAVFLGGAVGASVRLNASETGMMSRFFLVNEMKEAKQKRSNYDFSKKASDLNSNYVNKGKELVNKNSSLFGDRVTGKEEAETWKALAKQYEQERNRKK